jgi:hypothetical protein
MPDAEKFREMDDGSIKQLVREAHRLLLHKGEISS